MSQRVTFAAGTYQISFSAPVGAQHRAQSLEVLIDGVKVGTVAITPTGKGYVRYTSATFTVTSGEHTITFQGTGQRQKHGTDRRGRI